MRLVHVGRRDIPLGDLPATTTAPRWPAEYTPETDSARDDAGPSRASQASEDDWRRSRPSFPSRERPQPSLYRARTRSVSRARRTLVQRGLLEPLSADAGLQVWADFEELQQACGAYQKASTEERSQYDLRQPRTVLPCDLKFSTPHTTDGATQAFAKHVFELQMGIQANGMCSNSNIGICERYIASSFQDGSPLHSLWDTIWRSFKPACLATPRLC